MTYEIKYRREDEMKDSGIEWLGKVPECWKVSKLKYNINSIQTGNTPITSRLDYYEGNINWFNPVDLNQEILKESKKKISNNAIKNNEAKLFRGDSVLIVGIGATSGKTSYLRNISSFNQQITGIYSKINSNKYIYYQFKSITNELLKLANFTTLPILNNEFLNNIKLAFTIPDEQRKIANFLDLKTSKFDSIISKKEILIGKLEEAKKSLISEVVTGKIKIINGELVEREAYEMKNSGVEWLGMIPKEWNNTQFKRYIKINSGREILDESKDIDKQINVYGSGGVFKKTSNVLHSGESVLFGRKGTIGKPIYVNEKFWTVDTMYYSTCYEKLSPKMLYYQLLIIPWNLMRTQTAVPSIVGTDIGNLLTTIPELKEQYEIMSFLDLKTKEINSIIIKTKLQIEKLKQAKQSLISEAVTGKIDLRDWEIVEI